MNPNKLIIDKPHLVMAHEKITAWGITLFFWFVLLYLWQPIISLIAWAFKIRLFYSHMIVLGGYHTFFDLLVLYGICIGLLGGALIVWAKINEWRFKKSSRRTTRTGTDDKALCESFRIEHSQLHELRSQKRLCVTVDETGKFSVGSQTDREPPLVRQ